jgi:NAD(P)-dependent dehydrogenase (short-subunit alcohol dehydrogenase family)
MLPGPDVGDPLWLFRLDERVAIVTGAAAGIGARFARVLAAAGASVVLSAALAAQQVGRRVTEMVVPACTVTALDAGLHPGLVATNV